MKNMEPNWLTRLLENWQTVVAVFGGVGAVYTFIGEKYRRIVFAPFMKKKEKLLIDDQELSYFDKLQKHQEERLTKILEENNKFYEKIEELQKKSNADVVIIEKQHLYILKLQSLLKNNNIEYPVYDE